MKGTARTILERNDFLPFIDAGWPKPAPTLIKILGLPQRLRGIVARTEGGTNIKLSEASLQNEFVSEMRSLLMTASMDEKIVCAAMSKFKYLNNAEALEVVRNMDRTSLSEEVWKSYEGYVEQKEQKVQKEQKEDANESESSGDQV